MVHLQTGKLCLGRLEVPTFRLDVSRVGSVSELTGSDVGYRDGSVSELTYVALRGRL